MRLFTCSLFATIVLVLLPTTRLDAQSLARTLARTGLVQEDIDIMVRTGATLYTSGNARIGADVIWSNPLTRAFGMVENVEVTGDCVRIAYRFQTRRQPTTQTVTTRRCRVENRWMPSE